MGIKILDKINAEQTAKFAEKKFPEFRAGDIVRVVDNGRGNVSGTFTVSSDRYGVRVEKLFPFHSPWIQAIKVVKKGNVRKGDKPKGRGVRAKLYTERTFCSHKAVRKLVKK